MKLYLQLPLFLISVNSQNFLQNIFESSPQPAENQFRELFNQLVGTWVGGCYLSLTEEPLFE